MKLRIWRRGVHLAAACAALLAIFVIAGCGGDSDAPTIDASSEVDASKEVTAELDELEAAAKKEDGVIDYYFILGEEANRDLFNAFKERYPFVDFQVTGGDPLQLLEKAVSENSAGKPVVDVLQGGPLEDRVLNDDNDIGMDFTPKSAKLADPAFQLDSNVVVPDYFTFHTVYNTNKVKPEEAPTSLEDFTKPEWKGRFGIDIEQIDWFAGELGYYGEEEGLDLMQRLADNDPVMFAGAEGYDQVASGALPVAINLFSAAVLPYFEDGAPIEFADMDHLIAQPDVYVGIADSNVENTVKLYFAWLYTEEAQEILSQGSFKNPTLEGVEPPPHMEGICEEPCELFVETSEVFGDFDERVKQFRKVFTQ